MVFMVAVVAASLLTAQHFVAKRLKAAWRLSEEFGLSSDLGELLGPRVPEDKNAAVPLDEAAWAAAQFTASVTQKYNLRLLDDGGDRISQLAELDSLAGDPTYELHLQGSDALSDYRSLVAIASRWATSDFTNLRNRSRLFDVEKGIALRYAAKGRREVAISRLLRLSRITRKWEAKEPFMISAAVSVGGRGKIIAAMNAILRTGGPLAASVHDAVEAEFAKYEGGRATALWLGHTETLSQLNEFEHIRRPRRLLGEMAWDSNVIQALVHAHRINEKWNSPFIESKEVNRTINRESRELQQSPLGKLTGVFPTSGGALHIRNAFDRLLARARCLRIVNSWSRRGDFKLELDSLALPAAALDDPFDGKRLRVKRTPTGPIIYSVSDDLNDNGGDVGDKPSDQGLGPVGFKSDTP